MITVCSRWENGWFPPELERAMWGQLRGAFNIDRILMTPVLDEMSSVISIEQYETMRDALATTTGLKVFLEPTGTKLLSDVPESLIDIVWVLSNANRNNLALVGEYDFTVRIVTDSKTDLFGTNSAAIALASRHKQ